MADEVIDTLITRLKFETNKADLLSFTKFLEKSTKSLSAIITAVATFSSAIIIMTEKVAKANTELGLLSAGTGVSAENIQELGYAAAVTGSSASSLNSALESLTKTASEASRGIGNGAETFGILGINIFEADKSLKSADKILNDIADSFSKLRSESMRLEFAQRLGIDRKLLYLLQNGAKGIEEYRKEARLLGIIVDTKAVAASMRFMESLRRLGAILSSKVILSSFVPRLTKLIDLFIKWYVVNQKIINQKLDKYLNMFFSTFTFMYNIMTRVIKVVNSLASAFGGWKNVIVLVTAAMIALNASVLLIPALFLAAGTAVFLVLEDIIKYLEGADSAFGNFIKKFPKLESMFLGFVNILKLVADGWKLIFDNVDKLFELMSNPVKLFRAAVLYPLMDFATWGKEQELELKMKELRQSNMSYMTPMTNNSYGPIANTNNNSTTNNNNNTFTFHVSGDANKIERLIKDILNDQYSSAETNLSSPIGR